MTIYIYDVCMGAYTYISQTHTNIIICVRYFSLRYL